MTLWVGGDAAFWPFCFNIYRNNYAYIMHPSPAYRRLCLFLLPFIKTLKTAKRTDDRCMYVRRLPFKFMNEIVFLHLIALIALMNENVVVYNKAGWTFGARVLRVYLYKNKKLT
jgi:hypothetical protein